MLQLLLLTRRAIHDVTCADELQIPLAISIAFR